MYRKIFLLFIIILCLLIILDKDSKQADINKTDAENILLLQLQINEIKKQNSILKMELEWLHFILDNLVQEAL